MFFEQKRVVHALRRAVRMELELPGTERQVACFRVNAQADKTAFERRYGAPRRKVHEKDREERHSCPVVGFPETCARLGAILKIKNPLMLMQAQGIYFAYLLCLHGMILKIVF